MSEIFDGIEFSKLTRREDGSFVVNKNGMPYHVPNEGEWIELWQTLHDFAENNPSRVEDEVIPVPPEPTLAELKVQIAEELRNKKWEAKNAGITINGIALDTDDRGQATINGAVTAAILDENYTVSWKTAATDLETGESVWMTFNKAMIVMIAQTLTTYVQACFDVEKDKQAQISKFLNNVDLRAWAVANLDAGWPSRGYTI